MTSEPPEVRLSPLPPTPHSPLPATLPAAPELPSGFQPCHTPGPLYLLFLCLECVLPSSYDSSFPPTRHQLPRQAFPDHSRQKLWLSFCCSPRSKVYLLSIHPPIHPSKEYSVTALTTTHYCPIFLLHSMGRYAL